MACVPGRRIHAFRDLRDGPYATSLVVEGDGRVSPVAFADVEVLPSEVFRPGA